MSKIILLLKFLSTAIFFVSKLLDFNNTVLGISLRISKIHLSITLIQIRFLFVALIFKWHFQRWLSKGSYLLCKDFKLTWYALRRISTEWLTQLITAFTAFSVEQWDIREMRYSLFYYDSNSPKFKYTEVGLGIQREVSKKSQNVKCTTYIKSCY